MTISDPRDCRAVLAAVHDYLDGEAEEGSRDIIVAHLQACPGCAHRVRIEQSVRALIQRSCSRPIAPPSLRSRIITAISISQVTVTRRPRPEGE